MRRPEAKDQMTYQGFLADLMMAERDDRARRRPNGGSPAPTPTASPAPEPAAEESAKAS
jgi:hypothetical protein